MPTFKVTDPSTGQVLRLTGDSPPTEQELEQIFASQQQAEPAASTDFAGASVIEPVRAIASSVGRTIAGGVAGTVQALNPFADEGAGAQTVRDVQAGAFQPETQAGQQGLETLGELIQKGVDIANIPLSGLAGLAELVAGQGIDQAAETVKASQAEGVPKTLGSRVFEETGSPLAATVAETLPAAVGSVIGTKGVPIPKSIPVKPAIDAVKGAAESVFKFQTPTKKRIAEKIAAGSSDIDTARFKLSDGAAVSDKVARETINQGFDEGVIAAVKTASKADKIEMQKMVDIMEKGKRNKLFAAKNRPSDVAGDTLLSRVKVIRDANRGAGVKIDKVARTLKGQPLDVSTATRSFGDALDNLGVTLTRNSEGKFVPDFKLSQLSPGDRGPLKEVIRQMNIRGDGGVDALDVHKMKRIIDNNVTFGKVKTGISGDAERVLKSFRSGLDEALDTNFPKYNEANVQYSETISALNSIKDVAGTKMDLSGGNADKALGTLLRRTLSNQQSRIRLIDAVDEIDSVAKKHGGGDLLRIEGKGGLGNNDLLNQVLFVDELDRVFGATARTSFQGQVSQAVEQGAKVARRGGGELAADAVAAAAKKLQGINDQNAFKSIKELLKQ
jgi:hypothetical protein